MVQVVFLLLGGGLGLSADSLGDGSLHVDADLLGHAGGHVVGHVLDDGLGRGAVLGGHLDGGDGVGEVVTVAEVVAIAVVVAGRDGVLHILTDGVLVSGDGAADDHGLGGAVGLGVAALSDHHGLGHDLAEGHHGVVDQRSVVVAQVAVERVGLGRGKGGGGQRQDEDKLDHDDEKWTVAPSSVYGQNS